MIGFSTRSQNASTFNAWGNRTDQYCYFNDLIKKLCTLPGKKTIALPGTDVMGQLVYTGDIMIGSISKKMCPSYTLSTVDICGGCFWFQLNTTQSWDTTVTLWEHRSKGLVESVYKYSCVLICTSNTCFWLWTCKCLGGAGIIKWWAFAAQDSEPYSIYRVCVLFFFKQVPMFIDFCMLNKNSNF